MPLGVHFRPPVDLRASWDALHGMWPAAIVQQLRQRLPPGYVAAPQIPHDRHLSVIAPEAGGGGVAMAVWAPPQATLAVETDLPVTDEYEVHVYDVRRGRQLVAVIEIVSPANKDRPEHPNLFIGKCAALLQRGVAVSIVDLVTAHTANLYAELLAFVGHADPTMTTAASTLYAASCRWVKRGEKTILEAWSYPLAVGQPLPTLPLWLAEALVVPLDLEASYEQACHDLWIV